MTLRVSGETPLVCPPTANVEAYVLLLKARALTRQRGPSLLRAVEACEQAIELDPQDADARSIQAAFDFCVVRGDFLAAHAQLRELIATDPLNANAVGQLSIALTFARDVQGAVDAASRAIEIGAQSFYAHWALINGLMHGPDPEAGVATGRSMLARFARHPWLLMGMAYAHGAAGRPEAAGAFYGELVARAQGEYVQPMVLAVAAIGTGRRELVFQHLHQAAHIRHPLLSAMALYWPGLAPLRRTEAFAAVLKVMGWDERQAATGEGGAR